MKVLATPYGVCAAHVGRSLVVAEELRRRGHRVTFGCSGPFTRLIRRAGFVCHHLVVEPPEVAFRRVRRMALAGAMRALRRHIDEEMALLRRLRPDLILNDYRLTIGSTASVLGIPWVSINNAHFTRFTRLESLAVPEHPGLPHFRVHFGRYRAMFRLLAWPYNVARRRLGLAPVRSVLDLLESPHLNLLADAPAFSPTRPLPPHFRFIGPLRWQPACDTDERWLRPPEGSGPAIYLTMGTSATPACFRRAAQALADTGCRVVVTTGGQVPLGSMPRHFVAREYAPGDAIVRRCDLVVCHGGNGTVYQAFAHGVPVVGIPTVFDQNYNMHLVEGRGLGIAVRGPMPSPEDVRRAVSLILEGGDRYRENASALARELASWHAAGLAADAMESRFERAAGASRPERPDMKSPADSATCRISRASYVSVSNG